MSLNLLSTNGTVKTFMKEGKHIQINKQQQTGMAGSVTAEKLMPGNK